MGRKFELRRDHCGLKYLFDQPTLNAKQARWLEFLCEFDFEIKHIKGKENKVVDALNRKVHEMHVASLSTFQPYLMHQIINHISKDEVCMQIKDKLHKQNLERKYEGYQLEGDELLTYNNRIYIPNVADLRRIVMDEIHKIPFSSHPRYQKIVATTTTNPGIVIPCSVPF